MVTTHIFEGKVATSNDVTDVDWNYEREQKAVRSS